jgi:hypothetical protein
MPFSVVEARGLDRICTLAMGAMLRGGGRGVLNPRVVGPTWRDEAQTRRQRRRGEAGAVGPLTSHGCTNNECLLYHSETGTEGP